MGAAAGIVWVTGVTGVRKAMAGGTEAAGAACTVAGAAASASATALAACGAASTFDSSALKREAPLGTVAGAVTGTGGMSRRCERVNNGAFARVTEAASFDVEYWRSTATGNPAAIGA